MTLLNKIVRRIFAWPLCIVGITLVHAGGGLLIAGAWVIDLDVSKILEEARGK